MLWDDDDDQTVEAPEESPQIPDGSSTGSLLYSDLRPPAGACLACGGRGTFYADGDHWRYTKLDCPACGGIGYLGIDGSVPTRCPPGTDGKVAVMTARYTQGFPLNLSQDATRDDLIAFYR